MTPLWLAAIRAGLAAAVLLCVMLATRSLRIPKRGDVPVVCSIAPEHARHKKDEGGRKVEPAQEN